MKLHLLLEHHGIGTNPFADEDAQVDQVFKRHCLLSVHHPSWDKIRGDAREPATALVFGEKGAGKTALRLQLVKHLEEHNAKNPRARVFIIEYDDLNPFLDRFAERCFGRQVPTEKALAKNWRLWDHMDAILSLGVTQLVDQIVRERRRLPESDSAKEGVDKNGTSSPEGLMALELSRTRARDLLLLTACYDNSTDETFQARWHRLRQKLGYTTWTTYWDRILGYSVTALVLMLTFASGQWVDWLSRPWPYLFVFAAWLPFLTRFWRRFWLAWGIVRNVRVGNRERGPLWRVLMHLTGDELSGQPLPNKQRSDDRYELLLKFQNVLDDFGYKGVVVVVDRLDEPDLVGGLPERMRALLWPLLDNKLLKQPGLGFKLLLPAELVHYLEGEDREFQQRARLDKQNLIRSLDWTGEALYDLANARLKACATRPQASLRDLFDPALSDRRLLETFRSLRVPRHLFQFLHQVLVAHCNAHTDDQPAWKVSSETFEAALALYRRQAEAYERSLKAG